MHGWPHENPRTESKSRIEGVIFDVKIRRWPRVKLGGAATLGIPLCISERCRVRVLMVPELIPHYMLASSARENSHTPSVVSVSSSDC